MVTQYVINTPLINYFFYNAPTIQDGPNVPLAGGKLYFYDDSDHSIELPTYSSVFDPNNPVVNTNPVTLGPAGECPIFYLEDRFYFIKIYDANDVFQRSISHYNPGESSGGLGEEITNYIPNGQFRLHNDLPAEGDFEAGELREAVTSIAYGGWTANIPADSTSKNFVTFVRYNEWTDDPHASPRYALNFICTDVDTGDGFKDIRLTYDDVNKFANTNSYTVSIAAKDNNFSEIPVKLILLKNYGTDGDTEEETLLTTFNFTAQETQFSHSFSFGSNSGKVIGPLNDDFVSLIFRLPSDESSNILITDALQENGNNLSPTYPQTTERQDIVVSLGGGFPIPNPDGSDIGLYPMLTKDGWQYDRSWVGFGVVDTVGYTEDTCPVGWRLTSGATIKYTDYFSNGVPCKRLGDKYWNLIGNYYEYPPLDYINCEQIAAAMQNIKITNLTGGTITAPADGVVPTGFTFSNVHTGNNYAVTGYCSPNGLFIRMNNVGVFANPSAGTSGFTVSVFRGSAGVNGIVAVSDLTAASGLAGKYFTFSNPSTLFYVWFKVDGVGSDPTPGGTGIEVDLKSTYSEIEVCQSVSDSISGRNISNILTLAASSIPESSYWEFSSIIDDFYVWYKKDGVGTDPLVSGKSGIQIDISSGDTNVQVSMKTTISINRVYYALPNYFDMFLRGKDNGRGLDPNVGTRFNIFSRSVGDQIGTIEFDDLVAHSHPYATVAFDVESASGGAVDNVTGAVTMVTNESGNEENRPLNIYVNYLVKY